MLLLPPAVPNNVTPVTLVVALAAATMIAPVVVAFDALVLHLTPTAGRMALVLIPAPSVTPSYLVIRAALLLQICRVVVQATAIGFRPDKLGLL